MSNGVNFRKLAVDLRQELTACQKERDKGLARQAELQQRLDEAEKLLCELKRCKWNTTAEWQQEVTDLLASPGCADGEKP